MVFLDVVVIVQLGILPYEATIHIQYPAAKTEVAEGS